MYLAQRFWDEEEERVQLEEGHREKKTASCLTRRRGSGDDEAEDDDEDDDGDDEPEGTRRDTQLSNLSEKLESLEGSNEEDDKEEEEEEEESDRVVARKPRSRGSPSSSSGTSIARSKNISARVWSIPSSPRSCEPLPPAARRTKKPSSSPSALNIVRIAPTKNRRTIGITFNFHQSQKSRTDQFRARNLVGTFERVARTLRCNM